MSLRKEDTKTFKIRRGLDHNEEPAVEVEVRRDSDNSGRVTTMPLTPDVDKFLREAEEKAEVEDSGVEFEPEVSRIVDGCGKHPIGMHSTVWSFPHPFFCMFED